MFDVYETYGSRSENLQEVRTRLSSSLRLMFEDHESYYLGEYFLACGSAGQRITIEQNQLEDEDGIYSQEVEFPEYETLVRLQYRAPARIDDDSPTVDALSSELKKTQGLILLQRNFMPADDIR